MLKLATGVAGRLWKRPKGLGLTSWPKRSSLRAVESEWSQRARKEQTMSLIDLVEEKQRRTDLEPFGVGDTVKVHVIITEGAKLYYLRGLKGKAAKLRELR